MKKILFRSFALLAAFLLAVTALVSCGRADNGNVAAQELKTYTSYSAIAKMIKKSLDAGNGGAVGLWRNLVGGAKYAMDAAEGAPQQSTDTGAKNNGTTDYSSTNVQVAGVDEADIIKTDGSYLYIISNGRFIIVDVRNPALMTVVSSITYIKDATDYSEKTVIPVEMYLDTENKTVTLITYSYDNRLYDIMAEASSSETSSPGDVSGETPSAADAAPDVKPGIAVDGFYYGYWGQQSVVAQVIDVSDPAAPAVTREFSQEGSYVSSRRIGEYVYLITNKYLYYFTDLAGDVNTDLLIPAYKDTAASDEWQKFPVDSILVAENRDYSNFLILTALNTADKDAAVSSKSVLGAGQNVYASADSIYIASARYTYEEQSSADGTVSAPGGVVSAQEGTGTAATASGTVVRDDAPATASGGTDTTVVTGDPAQTSGETSESKEAPDTVEVFRIFEAPVYKVFTDIFKFSIGDGRVEAAGSGVVPGYTLNQFSMDENNGYFRIATTTGETWRTDEYTSMNNLYILDADLKVAGKVEGLGTTETIKSVRFLGDRAYMVTYRTTDPLFVFDLSDPKAPKVMGELKIPGYSEYLHPVSGDRLIGFGKNTVEENGTAVEKGYKVSVFDVSDLTAPKVLSTLEIGDRGTYSELSYNHKALLYSEEKNIIGFPVTIYKVQDNVKNDPWAYGMPVFSGYIVLGMTEEGALYERARIAHIEMDVPEGFPYDGQYREADWEIYNRIYSYSYLYAVKRGVFIGGTLFTFSDYMVKANSLTDFSAIGEIKLPGFEEINAYYFNQPTGGTEEKPSEGGGTTDPGSPDGGTSGTGSADAVTGSTEVKPG